MKRLLSVLLVVSLLLLCSGCGNIFVRGAINFSTVSGFVSIVQLTTVMDGGSSVLVTFVTFLQQGTSTTIGFCGDQTSQFPLNQMVTTNFNPGQPCATLIVVVVF
ncbi:MAG TPA: hypothetical protein VMT28_09990 [Terriglobales bacterium]|nr:hypothetical protein [Terriglobales bacterium]